MRTKSTTFLLCYFFGVLGVHRFYTGKILTGLLMLLTFGGLAIWWIVDTVLICTGHFQDKEGNDLYVGPPDPDYPFAGFWVRAAAQGVDGLLLTVVSVVISVPLGVIGYLRGGQQQGIAMADAGWLVGAVLGIVYFVALHASRHQATVGKRVFGIRLARVGGGAVTVPVSILRYLGYLLSALLLMLGFLMAAFHKRKRALHDLLAGTIVVYAEADEVVSVVTTDYQDIIEPSAAAAVARAEAPDGLGPLIVVVAGIVIVVLSLALHLLG